MLVLLAACGPSGSGSSQAGPTPAGQVEAAQVSEAKASLLQLVNAHRQALGLSQLLNTSALENQIQIHTDDMAFERADFGHEGMSSRCREARADLGGGNSCGEIVARGQRTVQAAFDAWLNSAGHKARLEDSRYNRVGIGLTVDAREKPYWGMIFLQF